MRSGLRAVVEPSTGDGRHAGSELDATGSALITGIEVVGGATRVRCRRGDRPLVVIVPVEPDRRRARSLQGAMRRIDLVRMVVARSGAVTCTIRAVGHRRPVIRHVPLATALGLGQEGIQMVVSVTGLAAGRRDADPGGPA
jgi:hypothetical protein